MRVIAIFINTLATVLEVAIFARVLLSWVPIDRNNRIIQVLYEITEPILGPIRRVLPMLGGLDLSPMIALILIQMAANVLRGLLAGL